MLSIIITSYLCIGLLYYIFLVFTKPEIYLSINFISYVANIIISMIAWPLLIVLRKYQKGI